MLKKITFAAGLALLLLALLLPAALAEDAPAHDHYATCQTPGVCAVCGLEDAALEGQHVYEQKKYKVDDFMHQLICDLCDMPTNSWEFHSSNNYLSSATEHWRLCLICNGVYERADHYARCTESGVCYYCGKIDASLEGQHSMHYQIYADYHQYSCHYCDDVDGELEAHVNVKYWNSGVNGHEITCDFCKGGIMFPHRYNDANPGVCMDCGFGNPADSGDTHTHTYNLKKYGDDGTNHWLICDTCDEPSTEVTPHSGSIDYNYNDTEHWYRCFICNQKYGAGAHTYEQKKYIANSELSAWFHFIVCDDCDWMYGGSETAHITTASWQSDTTGHWYACDICGEKYQFAAHYAQCNLPGVCFACGWADTSLKGEHENPPYCYPGETYHQYRCSICSDWVSEKEPHVNSSYVFYDVQYHEIKCDVCTGRCVPHRYDVNNPTVCQDCGYQPSGLEEGHEHRYNKKYGSDENNHWFICDLCYLPGSETVTAHLWRDEETTATCTQAGVTDYTCVCGLTKKEAAAALGHDWKETERIAPTCTDAGSVTRVCQRCNTSETEEISAKNHDWKEAENIAPTCVSKGYIMTVCMNCSKTAVEEIPSLGHEAYEAENTAPTCTEKGRIVTACRNCEETTIQEIPTLGHEWYEAKKVEPTCTEKGHIITACRNCEETTTQEISALSHEWYEAERVEATATEKGYIITACKNCDEKTTQELPVLSHTHELYEASRAEATCTAKGYIITACKSCSEITTQEIPALSHEWYEAERVEATTTEKGYIITACKNCDETTTQELPVLGHTHEFYEAEKVEPTCKDKGYIITACKGCDETTTQEIPALSHDWYEAEKVEATCKENGYTVSACRNCDETLRVEGEKVPGHQWGKVEIVPATCTEKGSETKTCTVCGTFTRKLTDPLGHEFPETGDSICARCGYEEAREENPVASEQPQGMEAVIAAFRAENPKAQVMHVALGQDELPMQLAGTVRFTIPMNGEAGEAFRLVQVLESGEIVEIAYEIIDGNMVFEADILGYFALLPV